MDIQEEIEVIEERITILRRLIALFLEQVKKETILRSLCLTIKAGQQVHEKQESEKFRRITRYRRTIRIKGKVRVDRRKSHR